MPTLDELRRWARGESVDGLLPHAKRKEIEKPARAKGPVYRSGGRYKVNAEGTDALLLFGAFKGETMSKIVTTPRGRKYLNWIIERAFDDALKAVCRYQLELTQRDK